MLFREIYHVRGVKLYMLTERKGIRTTACLCYSIPSEWKAGKVKICIMNSMSIFFVMEDERKDTRHMIWNAG